MWCQGLPQGLSGALCHRLSHRAKRKSRLQIVSAQHPTLALRPSGKHKGHCGQVQGELGMARFLPPQPWDVSS